MCIVLEGLPLLDRYWERILFYHFSKPLCIQVGSAAKLNLTHIQINVCSKNCIEVWLPYLRREVIDCITIDKNLRNSIMILF